MMKKFLAERLDMEDIQVQVSVVYGPLIDRFNQLDC